MTSSISYGEGWDAGAKRAEEGKDTLVPTIQPATAEARLYWQGFQAGYESVALRRHLNGLAF